MGHVESALFLGVALFWGGCGARTAARPEPDPSSRVELHEFAFADACDQELGAVSVSATLTAHARGPSGETSRRLLVGAPRGTIDALGPRLAADAVRATETRSAAVVFGGTSVDALVPVPIVVDGISSPGIDYHATVPVDDLPYEIVGRRETTIVHVLHDNSVDSMLATMWLIDGEPGALRVGEFQFQVLAGEDRYVLHGTDADFQALQEGAAVVRDALARGLTESEAEFARAAFVERVLGRTGHRDELIYWVPAAAVPLTTIDAGGGVVIRRAMLVRVCIPPRPAT